MAEGDLPISLRRAPLSLEELRRDAAAGNDQVDARVEAQRQTASETQKAANQGIAQLQAVPYSVSGLARNLVGPQNSGDANLLQSKAITDDAAKFAPRVQNLSDIHGLGDALEYGRNALVTNIPTIAPLIAGTLLTGGVAGALGGAGRLAAGDAAAAGIEDATLAATERAAAIQAAKATAVNRGTQAGALAGATALQTTQLNDTALDKTDTTSTARGRAAKAVLGSIVTGALDALPEIKLLERFGVGGEIAKDAAEAVAKPVQTTIAGRIAKHVLEQGAFEGTTEAIQAVGEHLTHKWVNDNEDLLGPAALADYYNSFAGGAIVGGALGGPAGFRNPDHAAQAKANQKDHLRPGETIDASLVTPDTVKPLTSAPANSPIFTKDQTGPTKVSAPAAEFLKNLPTEPGVSVPETKKTEFLQPGEQIAVTDSFKKNQDTVDRTRAETDLGTRVEESYQRHLDSFSEPGRSLPLTAGDLRTTGGRPNGFNLFSLDKADEIKQTTGLPSYEAVVASALPDGHTVGPEAIKAAGKYLKTGVFSNSAPLHEYLNALDDSKLTQFHIAAQHIGAVNADNVAAGDGPLSPRAALKSAAPTSVDPADVPANQKNVAALAPLPELSAKEFSGLFEADTPESAKKPGSILVTNSKDSPRRLKLPALMYHASQLSGEPMGVSPTQDTHAVITALGMAAAKGYKIAPDDIKPGLQIYRKTNPNFDPTDPTSQAKVPVLLTPGQANQIRAGLKAATDAATLARAQERIKPAVQGALTAEQAPTNVGEANQIIGLTQRAINRDNAQRQQTQGVEADARPDGLSDLGPRTRSPIAEDRVDGPGRAEAKEVVRTAEPLAATVDSLGRVHKIVGAGPNVSLTQRAQALLAAIDSKLQLSKATGVLPATMTDTQRTVLMRERKGLRTQLDAYEKAKAAHDKAANLGTPATAQDSATRKPRMSGQLVQGEKLDTSAGEKGVKADTNKYIGQARKAVHRLGTILKWDRLGKLSVRDMLNIVAARASGLLDTKLNLSRRQQSEADVSRYQQLKKSFNALETYLNNADDHNDSVAQAKAFGAVIASIDQRALFDRIRDAKEAGDKPDKVDSTAASALYKLRDGAPLKFYQAEALYHVAGVDLPPEMLNADRWTGVVNTSVQRAEIKPADRHSRNVEAAATTRETLLKDRNKQRGEKTAPLTEADRLPTGAKAKLVKARAKKPRAETDAPSNDVFNQLEHLREQRGKAGVAYWETRKALGQKENELANYKGPPGYKADGYQSRTISQYEFDNVDETTVETGQRIFKALPAELRPLFKNFLRAEQLLRRANKAERAFFRANKQAMSVHPQAMEKFVQMLRGIANINTHQDGTARGINIDLMAAMFEHRGNEAWREREIAGRVRRLAAYEEKYKNASPKPKFIPLIKRELELLRKNDLQGMIDEAVRETDTNLDVYMNAVPKPDLGAATNTRADVEINTLVEGDGKNSPVVIAKEQTLTDGVMKALGLPTVKIEAAPAGEVSIGAYDPNTGVVRMTAKRSGAARLDTLLHELGHHIVAVAWKALPDTAKAAIIKDYKAWLKTAREGNKTWNEVRSSRSTNFISKLLSSRAKGDVPYRSLSVEQRQHLLSVNEYLADNLAKALGKNKTTQTVISKFFTDLAHQLRQLYAAMTGTQYQPSTNIETWVKDMLNAERARVVNGASTAQEMHDALHGTLGIPVDPPSTTPINGADSASPSGLFHMLNAQDRRTMERALQHLDTRAKIYNLATPEQKAHLDTYGYDTQMLIDLAAAHWINGDLKIGTNLRNVMRNLVNFTKIVLGMKTDRQLAEKILEDYKNGVIKPGKNYNGNLRAYKTANPVAQAINRAGNAFERTVVKQFLKLTSDAGERLRASQVPALRLITSLIDPLVGNASQGIGFTQRHQREFVKRVTPLLEAAKDLSAKEKRTLARALQSEQRPSEDVPKLAAAYDAIKAEYVSLRNYAIQNGVTIKQRRAYFPVEIDIDKVRNNMEEFIQTLHLSNPEFEKAVRGDALFSTTNEFGEKVPNTTDPIEVLLGRLAEIAASDPVHVGEANFADGDIAPSFKNAGPRLMGFVQAYANAEEKKAFAEFQLDDLDGINTSYVRRLTKKIEAKKVLPEIGKLMKQALKEGATPEHIQQATDYVNIAMGSYRAELNPNIKWVFSKLDGVFGSKLADMPLEKWAHFQRVAGTYQNLRLLALAAFSSFTDPLGLYARSGDFAGSVLAYREALRAYGRDSPSELRSMAERLYVIQRAVLSDSFAAAAGGLQDTGSVIGRVNNAIFRLNGLEAITRFSRLAAVSMAHQFLIKHGTTDTEHGARYLRELGLTRADIKVDPRNPSFVVLNPKVEEALYRFVEESVLRPKSTQRPNWQSDPNFIFAAQYRGYLYSFYNTVIKRLSNEVANGNAKAAIGPIVGYIGVTMAAEIMRETVRYGLAGNPNRKQWDLVDYFWLALMRSGLSGPKAQVLTDARGDVNRGNVLLNNSWYGPSGQQLVNLAESAVGQKSKVDMLLEAPPGEILFASRAEHALHDR